LLCDFHDGTFFPASVLPPIATRGETGDESLVLKVPAIVGDKDRNVSYRATAVNDRMWCMNLKEEHGNKEGREKPRRLRCGRNGR
jgi:hypothetical protein